MAEKNSLSVLLILFNLITSFNSHLKYRFYLLIILSIFSSFLEILSISFLIPLINIFFNGEFNGYSYFTFLENITFEKAITMFIIAIIFSAIFRIFLLRLSHNYAYKLGNFFSVIIFNNFFNQTYLKIKTRSVNNILDLTLTKNNFLSFSFVLFINLIVSLIIAFAIVLFLFFLNGLIAFFVFFVTGLIYSIINYFSKKYINTYSSITSLESQNIAKIVARTFGLIKELKLQNKLSFFTDSYTASDERMRKSMASTNFISQFPRIGIETLLICLISIFLLFTFKDQELLAEIIPIIFIFIFSLQKILPFVQNIYGNFANILGYKDSIYKCYEIIKLDEYDNVIESRKKTFDLIELKKIIFSYPMSEKKILNNLSLSIKKNDFIGIFGKSGSGKTTLIELLSSFLNKVNGDVYIDNKKSDFNILQSFVFYVPSNVFIFEGSIAQNISLSFNNQNIDQNKIKKIIKMVGLDSFNLNKNLDDYGSNLSMGQIQRVGFARALYSNAKIIVLDEPTSSLDPINEKLVMTTLKKLKNYVTVILVSHKGAPLKLCNKVYQFKNGKLYGKNSI